MRPAAALACLLALVATADAKGGRKPAPAKPAEPEIEMAPEPPAPDPAPAPAPEASPLDAPASPDAAVSKTATSAPPRRPFYVRAGVALVKPLSQSHELELADINGAASLAVQNGPIAGSGAEVTSATIPAVIIGYQTRLHNKTVLKVPDIIVLYRA